MNFSALKKRLGAPTGRFSDHLVKSAVSSALGFAVDFSCLFLLVDKLKLFYPVAATLGFILGSSVVFVLSRSWVFPRRRASAGIAQYSAFLILAAVGAGLNLVLIWFITETFSVHYLISKIICGLVVFSFNFATRKYIIFSPKKATAES